MILTNTFLQQFHKGKELDSVLWYLHNIYRENII